MSKKFCLLRYGFSKLEAIDCERRHRHLDLREVQKLECDGTIELLDMHPVTRRARYVERDFERFSRSTQIGGRLIEAAVGGYKVHPSEVDSAIDKIEDYPSDTANLKYLGRERNVVLPGLMWNEKGLHGNWESDGMSTKRFLEQFNKRDPRDPERVINPAYPVRVILRPRMSEVTEAAVQYRRASNPSDLSDIPRSKIGRHLQEQKAALICLGRYWPEICEEIIAGPHSAELNKLPGIELPCMMFDKILNAYLS